MTIAREQPKISYCEGCSTEILWGVWQKSGKRMPAHADPRGDLTWIDGYWFRATPNTPEEQRFTSHFATCPKARR